MSDRRIWAQIKYGSQKSWAKINGKVRNQGKFCPSASCPSAEVKDCESKQRLTTYQSRDLVWVVSQLETALPKAQGVIATGIKAWTNHHKVCLVVILRAPVRNRGDSRQRVPGLSSEITGTFPPPPSEVKLPVVLNWLQAKLSSETIKEEMDEGIRNGDSPHFTRELLHTTRSRGEDCPTRFPLSTQDPLSTNSCPLQQHKRWQISGKLPITSHTAWCESDNALHALLN